MNAMNNLLYMSPTGDGWKNLAADEWFLDHLPEDTVLLYFYINDNAVIIGKNQNPWRECDLTAMEQDGVQLVRRVSGGGAVYHDGGNLNFSFIASRTRYDEQKQFELILQAVRSLGIACEFSGRNDLLAEGRKFSGNAFCHRGPNCQHHGTLLVDADMGRLQRYLKPDPRKLRAKGVASVQSRVCNLKELCPGLTAEAVRRAVADSYRAAFGGCEMWEPDAAGVAAYYEKQRSWEWRMGKTPPFDVELEERFPWGGVQLLLTLEAGRVSGLEVYSDAMDAGLPERLRSLLTGRKMDELSGPLRGTGDPQLADLAGWLENL